MIAVFCLLFSVSGVEAFAQQYKGAPVKKDRLIKALRSKQLQTRDIVTIIRSNGVNFALTPETKETLINAGARPEILSAVDKNLRPPSKDDKLSVTNADYEELIEQAIFIYEDKKNPNDAVKFLETAIESDKKRSEAYQMLGFVNLYGFENIAEAKKYMVEAMKRGGSAVFRVFHDDGDDFTKRCFGSLYISAENIRFEADDNIHTFEVSTKTVDQIKLDRENSRVWKNYPIFKIFLKFGESKTKFRFAPQTKNKPESQLAAQMVLEAKIN